MNIVKINSRDFKIEGFHFERLLGEGASSTVYKVVQKENGLPAVAKVFHKVFADEDSSFRFNRECRCLAALNHKNVVKLINWGNFDSIPYMLLEYVESRPLTEWISSRDNNYFDDTATIVAKIADGLSLCHEKGILHRDIKPDNIIITKDLEPLLIDFGLASSELMDTRQTENGIILGTISYMDPSILTGRAKASPATDTFSLGLILYEILAGKPAFPSNNAPIGELLKKLTTGDMVKLEQIDASIPQNLLSIVDATIATSPENRGITSCAELAKALKAFKLNKSSIRHFERSGTQPTRQTSGTQPTRQTSGTQPTRQTSGIQRTRQISGIHPTRQISGIHPTRQTSGIGSEKQSSSNINIEKTKLSKTPANKKFYIKETRDRRLYIGIFLLILTLLGGGALLYRNELFLYRFDYEELAKKKEWAELGQIVLANGEIPFSKAPLPQLIPWIGKLYGLKILSSSEPDSAIKLYGELIEGQAIYGTDKEKLAFQYAESAAAIASPTCKAEFYSYVAHQIFYNDRPKDRSFYNALYNSFPLLERVLFRMRAFLSLQDKGTFPINTRSASIQSNRNESMKALLDLEDYRRSEEIPAESLMAAFEDIAPIINDPYCIESGLDKAFPTLVDNNQKSESAAMARKSCMSIALLTARIAFIHYLLTKEWLSSERLLKEEIEPQFSENQFQLTYNFIKPWLGQNNRENRLPLIPIRLFHRKNYNFLLDLGMNCQQTEHVEKIFLIWNGHFGARFAPKTELEDACLTSMILNLYKTQKWPIESIQNPLKHEPNVQNFLGRCREQAPLRKLDALFPGGTCFDLFQALSLHFSILSRVYNYCPPLLLNLLKKSRELPFFHNLLTNSFSQTLQYLQKKSPETMNKMISELSEYCGSEDYPTELRSFIVLETATFSLTRKLQSQLTNFPINEALLVEAGKDIKKTIPLSVYKPIHSLDDDLLGFIIWLRLCWRKDITTEDTPTLHRYFTKLTASQTLGDDSAHIAWLLGHSLVYMKANPVRYFIKNCLPDYKNRILSKLPEQGQFIEQFLCHSALYRNGSVKGAEEDEPGRQVPLARDIIEGLKQCSGKTDPATFHRFTDAFACAIGYQDHEDANDILIEMMHLLGEVSTNSPHLISNWIKQYMALKLVRLVAPAKNSAAIKSDTSYRQSVNADKYYIPRQIKIAGDTLIELSKLPDDEVCTPKNILLLTAAKVYLRGKCYNDSIKTMDQISIQSLPRLCQADGANVEISSLLGLLAESIDKQNKVASEEIRSKIKPLLDKYKTYPAMNLEFHNIVELALAHDSYIQVALSVE